MKKTVVYLFALFLFFQSSLLSYNSNPKDFINELVNDAISKLADKSVSKDEKASFIEKIALDNVDINALGLYTLGELRKSSNEEDISNYKKTFQQYFLKSLTSRLTDYSSSKFEIIGEDKKSTNYTIVNSKVTPENDGVEIKIDWRVFNINNKLVIRDLVVEGLSLAKTQREEFGSILASKGFDGLIANLKDFISKN